ncbi:hypothetical protein ERE07_20585 [Allopusillimonas ginsengisoli]|nr:hypothetical protein ERE07_20585 [Allopusillimonas ginsengisoli]
MDWENSLLELTDLLPPVDPSPLLLQRIQATLGHDAIPAPSSLYRQPASLRPKEHDGSGDLPAASAEAGATRTAPPAPNARPVVTEIPRPAQPPAPLAPVPDRPGRQPEPLAPQTLPQTPAASPAAPHSSTPNASGAVVTPFARPPAPDPASPATTPPTSRTNAGAPTSRKEPSTGPSPSTISPIKSDNVRSAPIDRTAERNAVAGSRSVEHTLGSEAGAAPPSVANAIPPKESTPPLPDAIPITAPSSLPPAQSRRLVNSVWIWRGATVIFAALALALALMPAAPTEPPVTVVKVAPTKAAILQAPGQSSTPAWIVTFDPQGNVLMSPQVRSDIPADASVQLWTYNATLPQPRSMGLIDPNKPITVPATLMGELGDEQYFEMTLEPQGGSPTSSPSGPVLFIGRVVTFGAPDAEPSLSQGNHSQGETLPSS